jgi:hypothetical protein
MGLLRERPTEPREKKRSEVYGNFVYGGGGLIETLEGLRDFVPWRNGLVVKIEKVDLRVSMDELRFLF